MTHAASSASGVRAAREMEAGMQRAPKRARMEEPRAWPARLLAALHAVCGEMPRQIRPLVVESLCTGLNSHIIGP
eukprot:6480016-Amphidinium_carterae.2